jgi:hypothetical protein
MTALRSGAEAMLWDMDSHTAPPYGVDELSPESIFRDGPPKLIRCFVKGCPRFVEPPARGFKGQACPDHGIFCHGSGTYNYADPRRNIIVDAELFAERIIRHAFKYETRRLGSERSEDAVSWNVLRSLQKASCLSRLAALITGRVQAQEPILYLWGIRVSDDSFEPWDLLIQARARFEANLPVKRPLTEPDIALHLPGEYVILIEAKFTSPNGVYVRGPRRKPGDLTFDELLSLYYDDRLELLDIPAIQARGQVAYQLYRNTVFAEWIARQDGATTRAYHVNLVRHCHESETAQNFHRMLRPDFKNHFRRLTWEELHGLAQEPKPELDRLRRYMENKSQCLRKAFNLSHCQPLALYMR